MATLKTKIKIRRDTAANLANVVLEVSEPAYATDTKKFAIGDGSTKFSDLKDYGFEPSLSSFVAGPASSTDNAIVRFDGTTGKKVQNSGVTIDDSNNISTAGSLKLTNNGDVLWNSGSWWQRMKITDDSTANTNVFEFQQSSDSGANWTSLFTILDNGSVKAKKFVTDGSSNQYVVLGDGSTKAISDFTGTTYSADRGISLVSGKFGHSNTAVTAVTTAGLYKIKYDTYGHITGTTAVTKADLTGLGVIDSESDTLQTVTTRGATTNKAISTAGLTSSSTIYVTGTSGYREGIRITPSGELSSIWWNATGTQDYTTGQMWGISAYTPAYASGDAKKNTFRFRGPTSSTDTSATDQMWINTSGLVTSRGGFAKSGSSNSYVLLAGGGTKAVSDLTTDTGATSIEVTGTGNAVTSAEYNATNRKITLTKGTAFLAGSYGSDTTKFLRNDGSWVTPPVTSIPARLGVNTNGNTVAPNDNHTSGWAYYQGTAGTNGLPDQVSDAEYLTLGYNNSTWAHQLLFKFNGGGVTGTSYDGADLYTRIYNANSGQNKWSPWYTILTSGNYSKILGSAYTPKVSSSTDNAIVRFDGTSGSIQNSSITIDDSGNIIPSATNTSDLGSGDYLWKKAYIHQIELRRDKGAAYGRISFYSPAMYTWHEYMTPKGNTSPTGAGDIEYGDVTSWARRSLIENNSGYGWIWEACSNSGNATPGGIMALSSNTGNLKVKGAVTAAGFKHSDSTTGTNNHVLLAGGGTKALSDFMMDSDMSDYMPKSGGQFTGPISFKDGTALPGKTLQFIIGIDSFADGGQVGWQSKSDFLSGYVTNSSLSGYLPLTGGTLTGVLGFKSNYLIKPVADYRATTKDHTGAITITLPASISDTMVSMWVDVYNYSTNTSFSAHVGGYAYNNSTWQHNPFAMVYGADHTVRLGHNGTNFVIYIGELNSSWSYPQIAVRNAIIGYNPNFTNWSKDWTVSFTSSSFSNVTATIQHKAWTTKNHGSGSGLDADKLDGQDGSYYLDYNNLSNKPSHVGKVASTDNAVVRFDGTGGEVQSSGVILDDSNNLSIPGTIKPTTQNTKPALEFRSNNSTYYSGIVYRTTGNEAMCFENKYSNTSWIFRTKDPYTSSSGWSDVTPSMQIKNQRVAINKLIETDKQALYNLDVGGTIGASDSITGSVFKSDTTVCGMKVSNDNEISFASKNANIYFGYANRTSSSGVVNAYHFGCHDGTNTQGGSIYCGSVNASGYNVKGSSNSYVVLAGGGTKAISEFENTATVEGDTLILSRGVVVDTTIIL